MNTSFDAGDLVKVVKGDRAGAIARVQQVEDEELILREENHGQRWQSLGVFREKAENVIDEYEYEREAGHTGLTPKGVLPPQ